MRLIYFLIFFICTFLLACPSSTEMELAGTNTNFNKTISINWKLIKNGVDEAKNNRQFAIFTIKNNGKKTMKNNWTFYFNQVNGPITGMSQSGNALLTHINGGFFSVQPTENFSLAAGKEVDIEYRGANWAIKNR